MNTHLIGLRGQTSPDGLRANHEAFHDDAMSNAQVTLASDQGINADGLNALILKQMRLTFERLNEPRDRHQGVANENLCISDESLKDRNTLSNIRFKFNLALGIARQQTPSEAEPIGEQPQPCPWMQKNPQRACRVRSWGA